MTLPAFISDSFGEPLPTTKLFLLALTPASLECWAFFEFFLLILHPFSLLSLFLFFLGGGGGGGEQGLTSWPSSCLCLPSAGIPGLTALPGIFLPPFPFHHARDQT